MTAEEESVEIGSHWLYGSGVHKGTVRVVREVAELPQRGPGLFARAPKLGAKEHWTDWLPVKTLIRHGTFVTDLDAALAEQKAAPRAKAPVGKLAEQILREEGKRHAPISDKRRAANRVTSLRYKIKHPEKHGRTTWPKGELAQLKRELAEAEEARDALKEES